MQFIQNKAVLENFIETCLPLLDVDESYMLALFARKKYLPEDSPIKLNGITQLRREFADSRISLLRKISMFELVSNPYTDKNGLCIPEDCMTLYLMPNPRSNRLAAANLSTRVIGSLFQSDNIRLTSMARTELHKACSRKTYLDFDIDVECPDILPDILDKVCGFLGHSRIVMVHTKGGAHILLDKNTLDTAIKNTFYQNIQKLSDSMSGEIEIRGDCLVPIPGCRQGDYTPSFCKRGV